MVLMNQIPSESQVPIILEMKERIPWPKSILKKSARSVHSMAEEKEGCSGM